MNKLLRSDKQNYTQPYTARPFITNRSSHIQDQHFEVKLRAVPKCKSANSTHVITYKFLPCSFQKVVLE